MATFTASSCQTSASGFFLNPPRYIENGVVARSAVYTFTAAQSAGDVIQMVPIPRGAMFIDAIVAPNIGGANFTFGIGDGGSAGRFGNSLSTSGATALVRANAGNGYSYSVDDTIDITIQTATSASAAGTVRLTVTYSFDNAPDGNS